MKSQNTDLVVVWSGLFFFALCLSSAYAAIACGGSAAPPTLCPTDQYCCGNKPMMKRPRVDEAGTPPADLTESACISHKDMKGLDQAEQHRRKRFICPSGQFRQFNGDRFVGGGVPVKRPKKRQRYVRPLAAGLSWGVKDEPSYCTIGAILCSKADETKRWFVSNKHCVVDNDEKLFNSEAASSPYPVTQPSASLQDKVENPHAHGPEVIGKVVFFYHEWVNNGDGYHMDISLIELDPKIPVRADVLVGDNPMKAEPVRGSLTVAELDHINPKPRLCISGRSGGWGCFPVGEVNAKEGYMEMAHPNDQSTGTENINPHFLYPGNSGSVYWKKEDAGTGYRAVGMTSGVLAIMPIHDVLETIKTHTTHHLDLHVCTEESNKFAKKAGRPKKNKKQFLLL